MSLITGIASGLGALTQGISSYSGYRGQKSANQTNMRLAQEARDHDVAMWERTNQYNSPEMQMQRLKDAGLNPNLIYGTSTSGGVAGQPKGAPTPTVQNELASIAAVNMMPVISQYQNWQVQKAQIDNIEAQTRAVEARTFQDLFENEILELLRNTDYYSQDGDSWMKAMNAFAFSRVNEAGDRIHFRRKEEDRKDFEHDLRKQFAESLLKYQADSLDIQNQHRRVNLDLDRELKKDKMHLGDDLWARQLLPVVRRLFEEYTPNLFKKWLK